MSASFLRSRLLCAGERGKGKSGKPLHFKGSSFHRVIPQFMCQASLSVRKTQNGSPSYLSNDLVLRYLLIACKPGTPFILVICRVVTSLLATELVASPSMERSLLMRTSS